MTFLQPALLLALPALLLPVIIHLLNRLRYRTVRWAAMQFLVSVARSSTRHARLRHYLVLLTRALVILFLVLALSRPVTGGWLGSGLAREPDTVILLLDRSASMEAHDARWRESKRAHAITRYIEAAEQFARGSRFVLVESALNTPQDISGPEALTALSLASPTDTAADIPAMLSSALDHISSHPSGKTEIWLASDLQSSNWRPDAGEWADLDTRIASMQGAVKLKILALTSSTRQNSSVAAYRIKRQSIGRAPHLNLTLDLNANPDPGKPLPISVSLNGASLPVDNYAGRGAVRYSRLLALPANSETRGWGSIAIPSDGNLHDNTAYFAYSGDVFLSTAVVADNGIVDRYLRVAAAPAPHLFAHASESVQPFGIERLDMESLALLAWQAPSISPQAGEWIDAYVRAGGVVVFFPPGEENSAPGGKGLYGLEWGPPVSAQSGSPFRITAWDQMEGPLANADSGSPLPVASLAVMKRQVPFPSAQATGNWIPLATYGDGMPFIARMPVGDGFAFVCTSLPHPDWSTLAEGAVLLPMIQRMVQEGGTRLALQSMATCGTWNPSDPDAVWQGLDHEGDFRWNAGIYSQGSRLIALNRPVHEDDPECLSPRDLRKLMQATDYRVFEEAHQHTSGDSRGEIWPYLLLASVLCMILESGLLLSERLAPGRSRP